MELSVVTIGKKTLTSREKEWLIAYLECNNASKAARMIGIEKSCAEYGYSMRNRLNEFIQSNIRMLIGRTSASALETIYEIAQTCPDPKVRLAAAQDLLNRAGYKEAVKVEVSIENKTQEQLDKEIEGLLAKGGIVIGDIVDAEIIH